MADVLEARIIEIIESVLRELSANPALRVGAEDSMDTIAEWDSLTFMSVYTAVNDAFGINPDFDAAVHYLSVAALRDYLRTAVP